MESSYHIPPEIAKKRTRCLRGGQGYYTFLIENYEDFLFRLAPEFGRQDEYQFVWRGCRDPAWPLHSTMARDLLKLRSERPEDWPYATTEATLGHLLKFFQQIRGIELLGPTHSTLYEKLRASHRVPTRTLLTAIKTLTQEEQMILYDLMALGQHYGLQTPFLDWSGVPATALYFAFEQEGDSQRDEGWRVVYALNKTLVERECPPFEASGPDDLVFLESLAYDNERIISQAGGFTFIPSHTAVNDWIVKRFRNKGMKPALLRFLIRNTSRQKCLRDLDGLNINARTLFPDRIGASHYCNYHFKLKI